MDLPVKRSVIRCDAKYLRESMIQTDLKSNHP